MTTSARPFADQSETHLENLRHSLRSLSGIPNAQYQVVDGRVFVFEKLVHLASERIKHHRLTDLGLLINDLKTQAMVSPQEAIEVWGIVPEPYQIGRDEQGRFTIEHHTIEARLSESYPDIASLNADLQRLLMGEILDQPGDSLINGQPMQLMASYWLVSLPPQPSLPALLTQEPAPSIELHFDALNRVEYAPGLPFLSQTDFQRAKQTSQQWDSHSINARLIVNRQMGRLWEQIDRLRIDTLNQPELVLPEHAGLSYEALRATYPELGMLKGANLYHRHEAYLLEGRVVQHTAPQRENLFLIYLLAKVAGQDHMNETAESVGTWVALFLLAGHDIQQAMQAGRQAAVYDSALRDMTARIRHAIQYQRLQSSLPPLQGRPIVTMHDLLENLLASPSSPTEKQSEASPA